MSTPGRRNSPKPQPSDEEKVRPEDGDLLTSEDLFGDMVDAPPPPEPGARRAQETGRKGPIRVQVTEPGVPAKAAKPGAPGPGEVLPEDVAALLDAFSGPAEEATRAEAARAASGPPAPAADELLETLEELIEEEKPEEKPAPAKGLPDLPLGDQTPAPPWRAPAETAIDTLIELTDIKSAEPPAPAARTGTKFRAEGPDVQATGKRMALDLAALAEEALASAQTSAPAPPPPPPAAGEQSYGPYRLLERVAVGGMAEVFRAKRSGVEGFEKVLAVKRILPHLSDNKEFVDMFVDEAKMVAGLTHPNIVQIQDLGKIDKSYYIAMEYVHGRDLRSITKRAKERGLRIPMDLSVLVVGRVCAALEYAHRAKDDHGRAMKIVHRDISPQNILISFEGDVKLADFGIAKASTKASTTERGALRGKLLYMSPEQAWGKPMDRRSDIFSLGIVLYEMLTDQKPFLAGSEMSILEMVRECRVPPPSSLNPRIPERLERAVVKALERDPDERYQDAAEMARDLERALQERKAPTSAELARFMELLFDRQERGEAAHDEHTSGEHRPGTDSRLEVELDTTPAHPAPAAPAKPADLSIDKLLKRFGIK